MKKFLVEYGRPDKPVACPRCNSLNTKFCYFNNYNVKQPRHFCRECQRYWTAGGSLRNVAVGAGRRKHKVASSKPYGSNTSTSSEAEVGESAYTSLKPYHSLPFKQLVACSTGEIVQEVESCKKWRHDVMPMYDFERPKRPNDGTDMAPDSKFSLGINGHSEEIHVAEKLGFLEMTQKRARDSTVDRKPLKVKYEHEPGNPIVICTHGAHNDVHVGDAQYRMHDHAFDDAQNNIDESLKSGVRDGAADKDGCAGSAHVSTRKDVLAEHDDSTCCSSVTAAVTSSSSEGVSETNVSSPTTHTLTPVTKPTGIENQLPIWGPLMWPPWLWPFFINRGHGSPGMMPQVDPTLALGLGAVTFNSVPQGDLALKPGMQAESARSDLACAGPNFLHWPYMWNPMAWGSPWNVAGNGASVTVNNQQFQDPGKDQGSLCYPKTLRMDCPDEAAYRSILSTLGVGTAPHSPAGYFNAFQPKADVFQPKTTTPQAPLEHLGLAEQCSPHFNPAAQARSIAFQEGG